MKSSVVVVGIVIINKVGIVNSTKTTTHAMITWSPKYI